MEHTCPAAVITCIDFRFWQRLTSYFKDAGLEKYDLISMAGGAKNLVDEDTREMVFRQLEISTGKHGINKVYLVNHIDCGAYGGSAAFSSEEAERAKLTGDLEEAQKLILEKYPALQVERLLMEWDRIRSLES